MVVKDNENSLKQCFITIIQLVELDVVEIWTRGQKGLSVRYIYRGNFPNSDSKRFVFNENESKNLIEKSMSRDTFYFTDSRNDVTTDEKNFMSRICFHLPAQNVTTDVFFVGYSVGITQVCRCSLRNLISVWNAFSLFPSFHILKTLSLHFANSIVYGAKIKFILLAWAFSMCCSIRC